MSGNTLASFPDNLQALQAAGHWFPADCGGSLCTYASTPTATEVSVDWTGSSSSNSVQRKPTADTNTKADWNSVGTPTFGSIEPVTRGQSRPSNREIAAKQLGFRVGIFPDMRAPACSAHNLLDVGILSRGCQPNSDSPAIRAIFLPPCAQHEMLALFNRWRVVAVRQDRAQDQALSDLSWAFRPRERMA